MIYLLVERTWDYGSDGYHYRTRSVWSRLAEAQVAQENAYAALGDRAEEYPDEVAYFIECWEENSDNLVRIVRD